MTAAVESNMERTRPVPRGSGRVAAASLLVVATPMTTPLVLSGVQSPIACAIALWVGSLLLNEPQARSSHVARATAGGFGAVLGALLVAEMLRNGGQFSRIFDLIAVTVLVPLAYRFGTALLRNRDGVRVFLRVFVYVIFFACLFATYERSRGTYIFEQFNSEVLLRDASLRGQIRGRGFMPHPLILALFACVAMPLAATQQFSQRRGVQIVVVGTLLWGALSTDSETVIPVLITAGIAVGVWTVATRMQGRFLLAISAVMIALVTVVPLAWGALSAKTSLVTSSDSNEASSEFRAELFRQAPAVLADNPVGTGFGAVPQNHLVVDTPFGPIDGSHTIDSEYVLSIVKFGWLGLLFWILVLVKTGSSVGRAPYCWDIAVLIVLGFGSVLALQSWIVVNGVLPILFAIQWAQSSARPPSARSPGAAAPERAALVREKPASRYRRV